MRVAQRAGLIEGPILERVSGEEAGAGQETWRIVGMQKMDYTLTSESDVALDSEGYIVVVPMLCDEHDYKLLSYMKENLEILPEWKPQKDKD